MRRSVALLLLLGLVAVTSPASARSRLKVKTPRERTYYVVAGGEECALSTDPGLADPQTTCSHEGLERTTTVLGTTPMEMPALDGLPLRLDVTQPLKGELTVRSGTTVGDFGPNGIGQSQLDVTLTGTAGGKQVLIGETTIEPYTVTPLNEEYRLPFEIDADATLAGVKLDALTMSVAMGGTTFRHGFIPANASSTLTLPLGR